jgi:hypothetical protein
LSVPIHYLPFIDFVRVNRLATFKIISKVLFPYSGDFARKFYLRDVGISIKNNRATLNLIDRESY